MMQNLLLVAIGGALGAVGRYCFIEVVIFFGRSSFPVGTMLVNIVGSFLMGMLSFVLMNYLGSMSLQIRLLLATGFLGGFTTFSAFSFDVFHLINTSQFGLALFYVVFSVLFSMLAMFGGFYLVKMVF